MQLFDHQKIGVQFLKEKKKAILADDMGMGKTVQAIVAAGNGIVVCPASLKINWNREIIQMIPGADVHILSTTEPDPNITANSWVIINYDILEKKIDFLKEASTKIKTLILDEAHYIKGKSLRASCIIGGTFTPKGGKRQKFEGIASMMENVYCLTGTPMLNRPIELFNLLRAVNSPLGKNRSEYARRYCGAFLKTIIRRYGPPIRYLDESGATNIPELRVNLQNVMLRRKKEDALDLPEKIVSIMECEMSKDWQNAYATAWDRYIEFLQENPTDGQDIDNILMARHLVEITKLKQVCSQAKVSRMADDVRNAVEQGQKVIVFSQYTETINMLRDELKKDIEVVTLTGADDMDARQKAVDQFQNKESVGAFIANIKAGGVGLTLTKASIVMFADMEWSPELHRQAEDRAHRIGQKGTVNVYYYIATGTIEDSIVEILNEKKSIMDQVLDGKEVEGNSKSMQDAFLKMMAKKLSTG